MAGACRAGAGVDMVANRVSWPVLPAPPLAERHAVFVRTLAMLPSHPSCPSPSPRCPSQPRDAFAEPRRASQPVGHGQGQAHVPVSGTVQRQHSVRSERASGRQGLCNDNNSIRCHTLHHHTVRRLDPVTTAPPRTRSDLGIAYTYADLLNVPVTSAKCHELRRSRPPFTRGGPGDPLWEYERQSLEIMDYQQGQGAPATQGGQVRMAVMMVVVWEREVCCVWDGCCLLTASILRIVSHCLYRCYLVYPI